MIEVSYRSIADALLKLIMKKTLIEMNEWVTHFSAVLWADWTIMKRSTEMTSFQMLHEEKIMLSIELDVLMWQMLS